MNQFNRSDFVYIFDSFSNLNTVLCDLNLSIMVVLINYTESCNMYNFVHLNDSLRHNKIDVL